MSRILERVLRLRRWSCLDKLDLLDEGSSCAGWELPAIHSLSLVRRVHAKIIGGVVVLFEAIQNFAELSHCRQSVVRAHQRVGIDPADTVRFDALDVLDVIREVKTECLDIRLDQGFQRFVGHQVEDEQCICQLLILRPAWIIGWRLARFGISIISCR